MRIYDDFARLALGSYALVTLSVLYWLPDHRSLLNEFIWQTLDLRPRFPRVNAFLEHWRREIDAVISEVRVSDGRLLRGAEMRCVNGVYLVN